MTIIRRGRTALTLAALGCITALLLSTGCKRQSTASDGTVSGRRCRRQHQRIH